MLPPTPLGQLSFAAAGGHLQQMFQGDFYFLNSGNLLTMVGKRNIPSSMII